MVLRRVLLGVVVLMTASTASADPVDYVAQIPVPNRAQCDKINEPRPEETAACYDAHANKLYAKLSTFVEEAKSIPKGDYDYESSRYVLSSQAAFETYMLEQCGYWYTAYGMGSIRLIEESTCRVRLLQQRMAEFFLELDVAPAPDEGPDCLVPKTQTDMNLCAVQEFEAADGDLNHTYGLALKEAARIDLYTPPGTPKAVDRLREAQRTWILFRDQACAVESTIAEGGSMQPLLNSTCLTRLTRAREQDLRIFGEVN